MGVALSCAPQGQILRQEIQVQVFNLGGEPRKSLEGSGEVSLGRKKGPCRVLFCAWLRGGPLRPGPLGSLRD